MSQSTQTRLKQLMSENGLNRQATARLMQVSIETIEAWLMPETYWTRKPPIKMIEMLEDKLKRKEKEQGETD